MWGFERGRIYNRRKDIHSRFGGQQQGGIITPSQHPVIFIITGEAGLAHGYSDRRYPDGSFDYFGEGQKGDMTFRAGNKAILEHWQKGRDLLLFEKKREGLKFEGPMIYAGHHFEPAPDRDGNTRQAIVFKLRPFEVLEENAFADIEAPTDGLHELREAAFAAAVVQPGQKTATVNVYERSKIVHSYVVSRAEGHCEGCEAPAPFIRANGTPYLEPHHIRRLSDGGPDDPRYVIALCPNCHRRVHSGIDGKQFNAQLLQRMKQIEPAT